MLGEVFKKAKPEIKNFVTLRRLIVDLIELKKWLRGWWGQTVFLVN